MAEEQSIEARDAEPGSGLDRSEEESTQAEGGFLLPPDPAIRELARRGREEFIAVVREHPTSVLCWALLAEGSLLAGTEAGDVAGYAYARTGRDLGMDQLLHAGWDGDAEVAWDHLPNQGLFRCLHALSVSAERLGLGDEADDVDTFLRSLSADAWAALRGDEVPTSEVGGTPEEERATDESESPDEDRDDDGDREGEHDGERQEG